MFCTKCGKEIENGNSFCVHCGQPVYNSSPQQNAVQKSPAALSNKRKGTGSLLVVSIILLVCVMILPMFDVWGGIFSSAEYDNFGDVLHYIQRDGMDAFRKWVVCLTMSAFIPAIFSLIAGIARCKTLGIISSVIGTVSMLYNYVNIIDQQGIGALTDFEDCSISIGSHVALILHIVCFILALKITKKTSAPAPVINNSTAVQTTTTALKVCSNCGKPLYNGDNFCTSCGKPVDAVTPTEAQVSMTDDENKLDG